MKDFDRKKYLKIRDLLKNQNTICLSADCPNRYECFSNGTATFLLLGDVCTRNCKYCDVKHGVPEKVDESEIKRVFEIVKELKLKYVVLTSVTRDDLKDSGANHFVKLIKKLKDVEVEVLIPEMNDENLKKIIDSNPFVINHNIETVKRLFSEIRPEGDYHKSIDLLKQIKGVSKSGFMVGLGETIEEIKDTLNDLKEANVDIVTIGQYLKPQSGNYEIKKVYSNEDFKEIEDYAKELNFKKVFVGKYVRSSYHADEITK